MYKTIGVFEFTDNYFLLLLCYSAGTTFRLKRCDFIFINICANLRNYSCYCGYYWKTPKKQPLPNGPCPPVSGFYLYSL